MGANYIEPTFNTLWALVEAEYRQNFAFLFLLFMTWATLRLTLLWERILIHQPLHELHYKYALYEHTVSLMNPCACHNACRIIKLWWNNSRVQGEVEEASYASQASLTATAYYTHSAHYRGNWCFFDPFAYMWVPARSPHTQTRTSNRCLGLPSLFVCVLLICAPTEEDFPFSPSLLLLNHCGSSLQDSFQFGGVPWYPSNYPVLAIYIPRHAVCHLLVTEPQQ